MIVGLPDLLQTHDVHVELVEPRHDLVPTLRPSSSDQRIVVQLDHPHRALDHDYRLPNVGPARIRVPRPNNPICPIR
jgi:hypothetical protein